MPKLLLAAFLALGLLAPSAGASVCSSAVKIFSTPAQLTAALLATDALSPAVTKALVAANESLAARSPEAWKQFAAEITPYLHPGSDLTASFKASVARLESQPGLGAHLLKTVQAKIDQAVHQGALVDIGAGLVCVSFSSLKENLNYVDRYVDASIALLYSESDREEWNASFERLTAQITHYR